MKYEKGKKEQTRELIIQISTEQFMTHGYNAIGIAGLMSSAGLTNGAFYNHFKSKEDLFQHCVVRSLENLRSLMIKNSQNPAGGLRTIILEYLGEGHFSNPARGCAAATLGPEISRLSTSVKTAFAQEYDKIIDVLIGQMPDHLSVEEKNLRAKSLFALLSGTLQQARTMPTAKSSRVVLKSGIVAACQLCQIEVRD